MGSVPKNTTKGKPAHTSATLVFWSQNVGEMCLRLARRAGILSVVSESSRDAQGWFFTHSCCSFSDL